MDGIIYYNVGKKCLVRLAVSLSTLVQHCKSDMLDVTIISDNTSIGECDKIAKFFGVDCIEANFDNDRDKNWVLLNKCRLHEATPYYRTLFIDSDTVIFQDISSAFKYLDEYEFIVTQMSNWLSKDRPYRPRIKGWKEFLPEAMYRHAFDEPKAVNTGFYGWNKNAGIFRDWYDTAKLNRYSFIPDELACQILLPHYNHLVIGSEYNVSCKHQELIDSAKSIHFHGRKHCRIKEGKFQYNANVWFNIFNKLKTLHFVRDNIQYDKMLVKNIKAHNAT